MRNKHIFYIVGIETIKGRNEKTAYHDLIYLSTNALSTNALIWIVELFNIEQVKKANERSKKYVWK